MSKRGKPSLIRKAARGVVADFVSAMESIAPTALAQDWDNVGLLVGDPRARLRRAMLCIDMTHAVVAEAVETKTDLVMAYHPPIFKPIARVRADSRATDSLVHECIRRRISVYSTHTALDAADGGTNDVLAGLCGIKSTEPLVYVDRPGSAQRKLVVFVPESDAERVASAMFDAGAGHIGDYSRCSYRIRGMGSFLGGESTKPAIGKKGRIETVDEIRLEVVVPAAALPGVVHAMMQAHSYEEPAFDVYPLQAPPVNGIGRVGALPRETTLASLARKLKRATGAVGAMVVGGARHRARSSQTRVRRAIIVAGAAGSLPFVVRLGEGDVVVTGELRHHDALAILRHGACAIALGHWASERPVLATLADRLRSALPASAIEVSEADCDPLRVV